MRLTETQAALSHRNEVTDEALHFIEQLSGSADDLHTCDRNELVNIVLVAGSKYKKLKNENLELKAMVQDNKSARMQLSRVQEQYQELQEAHLMQSNFIQKLQKQQDKVGSPVY
jgi:hypothetical protein